MSSPSAAAHPNASYLLRPWLSFGLVVFVALATGYEAASSDTFSIRHERSKVRHSTEKEHTLWALLPPPSLHNVSSQHSYDTASMPAATMLAGDNVTSGIFRGDATSASGTKVLLFGGDTDDTGTSVGDGWLQSTVNATSSLGRLGMDAAPTAAADTTILATPTPHASVTLMPVTHKIRKLHKKQIIESRRADRGRSAKNHRSLAEAEHIAGRQVAPTQATPAVPPPSRSQLEEVLQLADQLDAEGEKDREEDGEDEEKEDGEADEEEGEKDDREEDHEEDDDSLPEYLNDESPQLAAEISSTLIAPPEGKQASRESANDTYSPLMGPLGSHSDFSNPQRAAAKSSWLKEEDTKRLPAVEQSTEKDYGPAEDSTNASLADSMETTTRHWSDVEGADGFLGPNQLASTSVRGITSDRQQQSGEVNEFDGGGDDNQSPAEADDADDDDVTMDDAFIGENKPSGFPLSIGGEESEEIETDGAGHTDSPGLIVSPDSEDEINPFLAGVVDAANEDEIYDWDEISRLNRRNLMRGRDVVTKFLQIVETQHSLGSNCEAGTSLNLGVGVVDRYAQDRFRVEAEVAVNRANMLTRIFKMTAHAVQADLNLLHASVLSMVEFDDDIFAAGHCFDWNEHPSQAGLFCPFAYRLPPPDLGAIFAKDLATEYHYLGNTSEWFFQARKNAEKVIAHNEQYLKAFHLYSNKTDERIEDDTLAVKYEDGRWSKPYYDCGGGNIWMLTYTVPFFGYENGTYHFKGTSGIDIDLRRVDIDQCPQRNTPGSTQPLNIFAGTDKCKQRTTMCEALKGLGFRRGSYKCVCRKGYYFPDTKSTQKFFNGSLLEEEYEKLMLGNNSTYNIVNEYECLPCAEGCDSCEDGSPCIAALNWPMRTSILVLACTVIGLLPPAAWFTFRYQQVKVVRAASPALLRVIALGAFFIYCTNIVMYPNPNLYTCTARIWLREIGFSLTYGALMLKTWRISVIFRVRSAKAVKITDAALLKRLGIICGVIGTCLLVRTLVSPPDVVVGRTADDLKAFLCKTDWWDYTFTSMEVFFLAWGVRLCIMVRKAPSEFNESRFISMAIYNEFLLTCFLNVSMIFLQSPANPDLLYIIFFCHTQLTVTLLLALIFGSKVYIVLRSGKSHQENIGMSAKASGAKFNFRPQVRTFANPSSITTSTVPMAGTTSAETKLSDQEALEEIRQLSMQLQRIQEMAPPKGVAVMTISSLLDGLKTPGGMMMVAAAATQAINAPTPTPNQLTVRHSTATPQGALPLLALNNEMHMYAAHQQNNNKPPATLVRTDDKAVNTDDCGHIICSRCLAETQQRRKEGATTPTSCQQLGSPPPEGSISFANIKLECMCSQPDLDLDLEADRELPPARRLQLRSAATNTPPELRLRRSGKGGGKKAGGDEPVVSYQICDKCKKKYGAKKAKASGKRRKKCDSLSEAHQSSGMTCSSDMVAACSGSADKRTHSSDDIIFYTTGSSDNDDGRSSSDEFSASEGDDDQSAARGKPNEDAKRSAEGTVQSSAIGEKDNDERPGPSGCPARPLPPVPQEPEVDTAAPATTSTGKSNGSGNGGSGNGTRPKRPDKLVLDLNDRSKYTKEVSV